MRRVGALGVSIALLAGVFLGMMNLTCQRVAAISWDIEVVDSPSDVGRWSSLAIDSNGYPHISYRDQTNRDLRYARWNGNSWIHQIADGNGDVGAFYTSLVLDASDNPSISYYNETGQDLWYVKWTGSIWNKEVVDTAGWSGAYSSIDLDGNGYPNISYYDTLNQDLKYARWDGFSWNIETVDSAGNVGGYTSMVLDSNYHPHICYYYYTSLDLKYTRWDGSKWNTETVHGTGQSGKYCSIAVDSNNYPHISYRVEITENLAYIRWDGSSWNYEGVDTPGNVGESTSIALDDNWFPHISYYDITNKDLKYARWTGTEWLIEMIDGVDTVGWDTSIVLDVDKNPCISYYDVTNANLKYAKGIPVEPSAPLNLNATRSDAQVTLTWEEPLDDGGSPITNYKVYRGTTPGGETMLTTVGSVLSYEDGGLTNGQTYYYQVSALNAVGEGMLSNEVEATPATTPEAPINIATTYTDSYVNITWEPPPFDGGAEITNYTIYRGISPGGGFWLDEIGNVLHYNDASVVAGATYYYAVSATNEVGEGSLSSESEVLVPTIPSAPKGLSGNTGNGFVNVTWLPPTIDGGSPIISYVIYRDSTQGGQSLLTKIGNITYYLDMGLVNGEVYYYKVSAENAVGEGPLSNEISATPANNLPTCSIMSHITGQTISGAVQLSGNANDTDGSIQHVEIRIDNGNWIQISGTEIWSYQWDTSSVVNGQHTIHVRSYDGLDHSATVSINLKVDNQADDSSEDMWTLAIALVLIVIVVMIVASFVLLRRRQGKQGGGPKSNERDAE